MNPASIPVFAVIYARVSTDAQALTPSLDVQEAQARACAELEQERDDYKARLGNTKALYFSLLDFCRGLKETISEMEKAQ